MARERKINTADLFQTTKYLLLQHGYEGFTFSHLAERLEVSRGALYKYYENKEELITDFMVYEMEQFLFELTEMENHDGFEAKFDFLIEFIFNKTEIQHLIKIGQEMLPREDLHKETKEKLSYLPLNLYKYLQSFIDIGKEERKIKPHIPNSLMIGMILQTVAIPNHFGIPQEEWVHGMKEMISQGMFTSS
ncbi:TetR/AcrR family transcriptional regulator [Neobacillus sp. K501]